MGGGGVSGAFFAEPTAQPDIGAVEKGFIAAEKRGGIKGEREKGDAGRGDEEKWQEIDNRSR